MKNTLALVLMVFGLVGCSEAEQSEKPEIVASKYMESEYFMENGAMVFTSNHPNYIRNIAQAYLELDSPKAKAIPIRANGLVHTSSDGHVSFVTDGGKQFASQEEVNNFVITKCKEKFGKTCLLEKEGDSNVWGVSQASYQNSSEMITNAQETAAKALRAKQEAKRAELQEEEEPTSVKNCIDRHPNDLDKVFQCMKEIKANSVSQTKEPKPESNIKANLGCSQYLKKSPADMKSWKECKYGKSTDVRDPKLKVNLICLMSKSNSKKDTDVIDRRGRKIGKIESEDNSKYSVNVDIDGDIANLNFDRKLLPESNSGTRLTGRVNTFEDRYVISYKPNKGNNSTFIINRYSGAAEIESEILDGLGDLFRDFYDAYNRRSSSKPKIIGSCEGGGQKKF